MLSNHCCFTFVLLSTSTKTVLFSSLSLKFTDIQNYIYVSYANDILRWVQSISIYRIWTEFYQQMTETMCSIIVLLLFSDQLSLD